MKAVTNLKAVSGSPDISYLDCKQINDFMPNMESLLPDWYGYAEEGAFKVVGGTTNTYPYCYIMLIELQPCLYYADKTIWGYKTENRESFERAWSCLSRQDFQLFQKGRVMSPSDFTRSSYLLGMVANGSTVKESSTLHSMNSQSMKAILSNTVKQKQKALLTQFANSVSSTQAALKA